MKRIIQYYKYLKIIKKYKNNFLNKGFQVGFFGKIGKHIDIDPKDKNEDLYYFKTANINTMASSHIKKVNTELNDILIDINLIEMVDTYSINKISKYEYILEYGFKSINTDKLIKNIIYSTITILSMLMIWALYRLFIVFNVGTILSTIPLVAWIIIIPILLIFVANFFKKKNIK